MNSQKVTRVEYRTARGIVRQNGRYALRWLPERVAGFMRGLLDMGADELQQKADFLAAYGESGTMGARWNHYASATK